MRTPVDREVGVGHLLLDLEVAAGAQTLDDEVGADVARLPGRRGPCARSTRDVVESPATLAIVMSTRSSTVNRPDGFAGLCITATTTVPNSSSACSMTSR